jgi:outer membrane scaffolding protein for murein synthesis (MipA/OmpV family)
MTIAATSIRPLHAAARAAALVLGLASPLFASAELTNGGLIGPGVRSRPAYDGSDSQRVEAVPVIRYFGQPLFVRSTQGVLEGGARMQVAPGLYVGAQVAYESGRRTRESDFLDNRSVFDLDRGASVGAQFEWDSKIGPAPITLLGRVRQHTESDRGAQADVRFSVGVFQSGRVGAGLFTQATWANAKSTRSMYGVTPQQSAASGIRTYDAGSGLLFASYGFLWSVDLAQDWAIVGSVERRHLTGDARRSPLTEQSTNHYVSAGVAYRF